MLHVNELLLAIGAGDTTQVGGATSSAKGPVVAPVSGKPDTPNERGLSNGFRESAVARPRKGLKSQIEIRYAETLSPQPFVTTFLLRAWCEFNA